MTFESSSKVACTASLAERAKSSQDRLLTPYMAQTPTKLSISIYCTWELVQMAKRLS